MKFGDLIVHWSINVLKKFQKNLLTNFVLTTFSVKVALEITKRAQHCVSPDSYVFMCFEIAQVHLRSVASRVYKGHLQNEWVITPFRKYPKGSKFVCNKSSLRCMHNLYPFYWNPRYLETPLIDYCETSHSRKHLSKEYVGLKFDFELKPLRRHCHITFIPIARKLIP